MTGIWVMLTAVVNAAAAGPDARIEGADFEGRLYRLDDVTGPGIVAEGVAVRHVAPPGRMRLRVFCRYNDKGQAYRMTPIVLRAGGATATLTVDALAAGTPLRLDLVHRGGPLDITVREGRLHAEAADERRRLEARAALADGPAVGVAATAADDEDWLAEMGLGEMLDPVDAAADPLPVLLIERIEIESRSGPVLVTAVKSDRITYAPGDTARIEVRLENLADRPVEGFLTVAMTADLSASTPIFETPVRIGAGSPAEHGIEAPLGMELWGRGFEARIETAEGADHAVHAVSVVTNAFMAAFFGRGLPMHGSERWSPEDAETEAERIARENMAAYCNVYEAFSWAPCSFSQMTVDHDEPFWSGQTQYVRRRSTIQTLHRVFRHYGIGAITYGIYCGAGLPGVRHAFRYPERMHVFKPAGFGHEAIHVDILDRMLENRYRRHAYDEDEWAFWISSWTLRDSNRALIDFAADEVARSAAMFDWQGVRWDAGWATAHANPPMTARAVHYAERRLDGQTPSGFLHGYNISKLPRHAAAEGAFSDIELAAAARGGGLIMTEHYRDLQGRAGSMSGVSAARGIAHLQAIGDAARLHGGYLLAIYDEGSIWNAALVLAAGARPMGQSLPFNRFATRFSAHILDPGMRRLANPSAILQPVANADFRWSDFVYEKRLDDERTRLVAQWVNVTDALTFYAAGHRAPTGVSPPRRDVVFDLDLPEGYQPVAAYAFDAEGAFEPLPITIEAGRLTIPSIGVWTLAAIEFTHPADAGTLAERTSVPLDLRTVPEHPDPRVFRAALDAAVAAVGWDGILVTPAVLDAVLADGPPEDANPAAGADEPPDFAAHRGRLDAGWLPLEERPPLTLRRNGRPDVLLVRGVMAHRARVEDALSALPDAMIHDAYLEHGRAACDAVLSRENRACLNGWPERETLAGMDAVVLVDIPATAFNLEQRGDLESYVRGGGAMLALGGWYSLSKGSWEGSFLEDILPVRTLQRHYLLRLRPEDAAIDAAPAFRELLGEPPDGLIGRQGIEWLNHAEPRETARVLLTAGGQPLLAHGAYGDGQAMVWTGTYSGRPVSPYWESEAWPHLLGRLLRFLTSEAGETSPPDAGLAARLESAADALDRAAFDALAGAAGDAVFDASIHEHLTLLLREGDDAAVLAATRFLFEQAHRLDPAHYRTWTDRVAPRVSATPEWAGLAERHVNAPPPLLGDLTGEIAAVALPGLTAADVNRWRIDDPVTRLICLAATADPAALPALEGRFRGLVEREAEWDRRIASGDYSSATVNHLHETRLLRPFVAWALIQCGRRDAETLYQFCRGALELPFYLWRQHWILETDQKRLTDARRAMNPEAIAGAEARIRATREVIRQLRRAEARAARWFTPESVGLDDAGMAAAVRALREADSRKSLPLARAYLIALPPDARPAFAELKDAAALPEIRRMAARWRE